MRQRCGSPDRRSTAGGVQGPPAGAAGRRRPARRRAHACPAAANSPSRTCRDGIGLGARRHCATRSAMARSTASANRAAAAASMPAGACATAAAGAPCSGAGRRRWLQRWPGRRGAGRRGRPGVSRRGMGVMRLPPPGRWHRVRAVVVRLRADGQVRAGGRRHEAGGVGRAGCMRCCSGLRYCIHPAAHDRSAP